MSNSVSVIIVALFRFYLGKWKVKKTKSVSGGDVQASTQIKHSGDASYESGVGLSFDIVDVNEPPSDIQLLDIASKSTRKGEQMVSNITLVDPDFDDILSDGTIPIITFISFFLLQSRSYGLLHIMELLYVSNYLF